MPARFRQVAERQRASGTANEVAEAVVDTGDAGGVRPVHQLFDFGGREVGDGYRRATGSRQSEELQLLQVRPGGRGLAGGRKDPLKER